MPVEFVLVSGAWHLPVHFKPLIEGLRKAGHFSRAVTPKCVNSSPAANSFQPDVDAVRAAVEELLRQGTDVVLVMHSYGGMVGTEASGVVAQDADKYPGKIRRLVYVAAHVPSEGQNLLDVIKDAPVPLPPGEYVELDHVSPASRS